MDRAVACDAMQCISKAGHSRRRFRFSGQLTKFRSRCRTQARPCDGVYHACTHARKYHVLLCSARISNLCFLFSTRLTDIPTALGRRKMARNGIGKRKEKRKKNHSPFCAIKAGSFGSLEGVCRCSSTALAAACTMGKLLSRQKKQKQRRRERLLCGRKGGWKTTTTR